MDGLIVLDKPPGPTSHDVVARVRRALREPRIGHTGTLDPLASGVLPLVVGRATRLAQFFSASDKEYDASICLGIETDSYDADGAVAGQPYEGPLPDRDALERALDAFRGTFQQQPPAFSAKKIGGRRSYQIARARALGAAEAAALPEPATVTAHRLEVIGMEGARVTLRIVCSAGFYVRALAHDVGRALGTGAHLVSLRRRASGPFAIGDAMALDEVERDPAAAHRRIVPLRNLLADWPGATLTDEGVRHAVHGRAIGPDVVAARYGDGPRVRLLDAAGNLVGIASRARDPALLHPSIILI